MNFITALPAIVLVIVMMSLHIHLVKKRIRLELESYGAENIEIKVEKIRVAQKTYITYQVSYELDGEFIKKKVRR